MRISSKANVDWHDFIIYKQGMGYSMMIRNYVVVGFLLVMFSCQTAEKRSGIEQIKQNEDQLIVGNIDTAKIISQLFIKESDSCLNLLNEKIDNLSNRMDTLELTYYFGFCDCQSWIYSGIYYKALAEHSNLNELDSRGQIEFNLSKHGFYIEAANEKIRINWRTNVNGTTIRFIGREYIDKRLPKDGDFTVPNPPKGRVFRYYQYQMLRPYKVWGPHKLIEVEKETGDSIKEPTILTVR